MRLHTIDNQRKAVDMQESLGMTIDSPTHDLLGGKASFTLRRKYMTQPAVSVEYNVRYH